MRRTENQILPKPEHKVVPKAEYVPAELNLETVGYFSAGYKRKYPSEGHQSKVVTLGSPDRVIEIVPSAKYGYPNSDDLDFYRAFLKICDERATLQRRQSADHYSLHPELPEFLAFSTRELIRYTGRLESARERQAVREWIKRGTFTGIEGGLYRAETRKRDSEFGGPLFSRYVLVGEKMTDGTVATMNYVWPNSWFRSNYFFRYFRPVDLAFHRRLKKAIAKTLYPLLDTGWYAADGGVYTKRYTDLCTILFIPAYKSLSLVKRQLDPSHEALRHERFLSGWEYATDKEKLWTGVVRWWPGDKWLRDQEERQKGKDSTPQLEDVLPLLPAPLSGDAALVPLRTEPVLEETDVSDLRGELVREFYTKLGQPKISRQKLQRGIMVLADLEAQGFSQEEVNLGLEWMLKQKRHGGRPIYSLSLLPEVIGQVLEETTQEKKRVEEYKKRGEKPTEQLQSSQDIEKIYQSLSAPEQETLRDRARESLLEQGIKKEFLLEGLIRGEAYRLLRSQFARDLERNTDRGPDS